MLKVKEKISWHTEKRKLSELIPLEGNPRQATQKQWKDLEQSLTRFNLADPIIINCNNKIIGGHFRVKVLKERDKDQIIDVRVPNRQLTTKEERELCLRLNKNTGEWNLDELANFDEELLKDVSWEKDELIELFSLNSAKNVEIDKENSMIITVEMPEAPKLKERMAFYCDNMDEYNKISKYFKKKENELDKDKLLKML